MVHERFLRTSCSLAEYVQSIVKKYIYIVIIINKMKVESRKERRKNKNE